MGLFTSKKLETLEELFVEQLRDLYDAENQLTKALPKMADAAHSDQLKSAFQEHLGETEGHVARLEQVFNLLGQDASRETCEAMEGLISEGEGIVKAKGDSAVLDAALIAAAQRVEHYEMAGYGTARSLATSLGNARAAELLQQTLDEEAAADRKLTDIAESFANVQARNA